MGSVIVGSKALMARALRMRKALGGGMRQVFSSPFSIFFVIFFLLPKTGGQVGVLAAAGLFALDHQVDFMYFDH